MREKCEKFGQIESIDVVNLPENGVCYAELYVTFESNKSAYRAFMVNQSCLTKSNELLKVVPANTWHQPNKEIHSNHLSIDEDKCFILTLNDNCLLQLFDNLELEAAVTLSNVCIRFHLLLNAYYFPRIKSFTVFLFSWPLNFYRNILKCIGPHLTQLRLDYRIFCKKAVTLLQNEYEERATFKILQHINRNLEKITIYMPQGKKISKELYGMLAPALKRIIILEIFAEFDCESLQQLRILCPNLKTLFLTNRRFDCNLDHEHDSWNWPSLEKLKLIHYLEPQSECRKEFQEFIKSNSQLKFLKLTNVNDDLFRIISTFSIDLQHLELQQHFDVCSIHSESTLCLLKNLTNLKIFVLRIRSTHYLDEIRDQVKSLSRLSQLKIIILIRNYTPPIQPYDCFPFVHIDTDISIQNNDISLNIGPNSTNIDTSLKQTYLINIINTANPSESSFEKLEETVLYTFQCYNEFFPKTLQTIVFKLSDCYQYIHVCTTK